jgi:hypothetical protein
LSLSSLPQNRPEGLSPGLALFSLWTPLERKRKGICLTTLRTLKRWGSWQRHYDSIMNYFAQFLESSHPMLFCPSHSVFQVTLTSRIDSERPPSEPTSLLLFPTVQKNLRTNS